MPKLKTNKAAKKTEDLAHTASLRIKVEGTKNKLSANFEKLGRLTYKQLKSGESQAEKISEVLSEIDELIAKEKEIKKQLEKAKESDSETEE